MGLIQAIQERNLAVHHLSADGPRATPSAGSERLASGVESELGLVRCEVPSGEEGLVREHLVGVERA